ncbi:MAG: lipopolysaccharide biosynthesis protein [Acidobacteriota bacterium]
MDAAQRLRRDIAWNLVPVVLLGVVGIGLQLGIAGWWDAEALAVFDLVMIPFFAGAVLGAFGIQYSVLRAIAEAPEDRPRVAAIVIGALVPNVVLAVALTAAFVALRRPIGHLLASDDVAEGMLWAAPGLFCFAVNKVLLCVVNGQRRMRAFAIYMSVRYLLLAIGLLVAHALGVTSAHLSGLWTFGEGTLLVVLVIELVATVPLARGTGWRAWTREHLDYGARGVAATLAYEVNSKLDVWMLGAFHVAKALVGVYALAAALNEGAAQLAVAVASNLNPMMAADLAAGRPADVAALARRTRRWFVPAFVGACALGVIVYPLAIPAILANPEFVRGDVPFAILLGGLALASPYLPFKDVLLMAHRPGWHTVLVVSVVAINFVADLVLIPPLGLRGAAIATSTAMLATALLVRYLARFCASVRF